MPRINDEHIAYIRKDLQFRGIIIDNIEEELLDHICSAVEVEMDTGQRFIDAYQKVLISFGKGRGLRNVQQSTIRQQGLLNIMMLRHYITIAVRNCRKQSLFTSVNIGGLAMGVTACLLTFLLIVNEVSYDRYHEKADRIVRITNETTYNGNLTRSVTTPAGAAKAIKQDFPEAEAAAYLAGQGLYFVKRAEGMNNIKVERCTFTSNDLFSIFSIPFTAGDQATALLQPNTVLISERTANALFGNEDPLHKPLIMDNHMHVTVVGVFRNFPEQSHIKFEILLSDVGTAYDKADQWVNDNLMPRFGVKTYVLLREGVEANTFATKLNGLVSKYIAPVAGALMKSAGDTETNNTTGNSISFGIQPLKEIHLDAGFQGEFEPAFDSSYVYILAAIGLFILGIASINFVNLSTARSSSRAKEVGMRKVMGSLRSYLVRQFLIESITLSTLSIVLAMGLAWVLLPLFNTVSGRQLQLPWNSPLFYLIIAAGTLTLGILAGLYPSIFLSSFKPVKVLKGNLTAGIRGASLRNTLVIVQFSISIFLVIGTIVLFGQLDFINSKNVGFSREGVIMIEETYLLRNQKESYKNEALKSSVFAHGTISGFLPASGPWRLPRSWWRAGEQNASTITSQDWAIDPDYIQTLGMRLKIGRNFLNNIPADSSAILINEAALRALGLHGDVIGQNLATYRALSPSEYDINNLRTFTIVGVVEDFHFESLKTPIGPVVFRLNSRPSGSIVFRFEEEKVSEAVTVLEELWKKMAPGEPFTYSFMESGFAEVYTAERKLSQIFGMFTGVALLVACLGLFALITFTTEQRKKEIGIRKVMGASVSNIVFLFSKELGKLVLTAGVIAFPLAWYTVEWWLSSYSYRIEAGPSVYITAGLFAMVIAWLTTGFQSIRSATANPAESLRSE